MYAIILPLSAGLLIILALFAVASWLNGDDDFEPAPGPSLKDAQLRAARSALDQARRTGDTALAEQAKDAIKYWDTH